MDSEQEHQQLYRPPLVYGDPEAPLTTGVWVRWLQEQYEPNCRSAEMVHRKVEELRVVITGNGSEEKGMQFKVNEMWSIIKSVKTITSFNKGLWFWLTGLLIVIATVLSIATSLQSLWN